MDASELGRWTRFAAKGGIGKCTAIQDCVAEGAEDLMFLKDDEIIVLMQISGQVDLYLGYCEGVVGHFHGGAVRFHGRLKKPVLTKRQSTTSPASRPASSQSAFAASARDAPSPAISIIRDAPSPIIAASHDVLSPAIAVTREPEMAVPAPIAPSASLSSISAEPCTPTGSPNPERSMSYESQATSLSSFPKTPADDSHDDATIASDRDHSDTGSLAPPIRLDQLTKQLSHDSPIEHLHSPDPTTSRFPPADRDSSVYSEGSSSRISVALSDNDGVGNIGLSLLQDFIGGDDDDDSSADESRSIRQVQSPESTLGDVLDSARSDSQYSGSPRSVAMSLDPPPTSRSERSERSESQRSGSRASMSQSAQILPATRPESEYDFGGEDWEGADDIYDQYRYSRFSMASRVSRFSKGSMHTTASASSSDAPPMPAERPSLDSVGGRDRMGAKGKIPSKLVESTTSEDLHGAASPLSSMSKMQKNRPAPLTFNQEAEPSPLLHATFGSPQASPTVPSATSGTFGSPTLMSPVYPTNTGAATNVKDRTERDHGSNSDGESSRLNEDRSRLHRDEAVPMTAVSQAAEIVDEHISAVQRSPPPTPALSRLPSQPAQSSAVLEKQMLANAEPSPDQPPPPPYSPTATPGPASSSSQTPLLATSPPPQSTVLAPGSRPQARPIDPNRPAPHPLMRQSLFAPHPGAPKPAAASLGPMYGRQLVQQPPAPPQHVGPPPGSAHHILGVAFIARREGRPAPPTIYGRFEYDLSTSMGPVPITFGIEPQNNVPANKAVRPPMPWAPSRIGSPASQLAADLAGRRSADPAGRRSATSPPIPGMHPAQLDGVFGGVAASTSAGVNQPIPRTNFRPVVHAARPRSRSFSGMTNGDLTIRTQALNEGSRDDTAVASPAPLSPPLSPIRPLQIPTKRSKSAMATPTTVPGNVPAPQRATVSHSSTVLRGLHAPSPLSLSQNNTVIPPVRSRPPRASTNPLPALSPSADALAPGVQITRALSLDQTSGKPTSDVDGIDPAPAAPAPQIQSPLVTPPETLALSSSPPSSPGSAMNFPQSPTRVIRHSRSAILPDSSKMSDRTPTSPRIRTASHQSDPRPSVDTIQSHSTASPMTSPIEETSDGGGTLGLRVVKRHDSRPQMAPLRLVTSNQSSQSVTSPTVSISTSEHAGEQDTVQVQDTDFELIKPTLPSSPFAGSYESLPSPIRPGGNFLRTDSPAMSDFSGSSLRHQGDASPSDMRSPKETEASLMEAHRQRELRWISALASIPASQARKSKKIRKLVLDGVPASVRYQVWAALTDSKGKRMEGLYQRLALRGKVSAAAEIGRDIEQSFTEHPQLQDGSLAKLLQVYLRMVPDVQYTRGLAMIAAQLLLQSPEEDAFWTFVSLMDTHLRPYFSNSSVLLEVDSSLFGRVLETNDAAVAKKIFGDMAIAPVVICRGWFTTVFADALPSEYLVRLWDVFLFEGVSFLFRAALAIFSCNRRTILQSTSQEALLGLLYHPPPISLSSSPDAFIELAFSMKLKDDVLKQRKKLEAQLKRRTAQSRPSPISPANPQTISLPKHGI